MRRRATLTQVAEELGVSVGTVSNAYNRPDQLSAALRERILETARRLGYPGPDPLARGLRRRRAGALGVLYEDRLSNAFADPAEVLFLQGLSAATEEVGIGLLLLSGAPGEERDPGVISGAVVDGFVVYSMAEGDPLVGAALERRLPVVIADQPRRAGAAYVGIDDEAAARAVAEHVLGLGHRHLGVVTFALSSPLAEGIAGAERQKEAAYPVSRNRLRGFAAAFEAAGLGWAGVPVYECAGNSPQRGREAAEALLAREPRTSAILAFSDQLALGALEAARGLGLSVPAELSIAGFDDVPEAARSGPPLTTVHQPHVQKGLAAGRMLLAQLGGEEEEAAHSQILSTRLVVRSSTAPPGAVP